MDGWMLHGKLSFCACRNQDIQDVKYKKVFGVGEIIFVLCLSWKLSEPLIDADSCYFRFAIVDS